MKHIISNEVLAVLKNDAGEVIKVKGNGSNIRKITAYNLNVGKYTRIKIGAIIGYTLEEKDGDTVLTLDTEKEGIVYQVIVDSIDRSLVKSLPIFGMENVVDQMNQIV